MTYYIPCGSIAPTGNEPISTFRLIPESKFLGRTVVYNCIKVNIPENTEITNACMGCYAKINSEAKLSEMDTDFLIFIDGEYVSRNDLKFVSLENMYKKLKSEGFFGTIKGFMSAEKYDIYKKDLSTSSV